MREYRKRRACCADLAAAAAEARPLLLAEPALSSAGPALGRMPELARRDAILVGDSEVILLKPADLVTQARGLLELEVGGGFPHPLLEVPDIGLEVVAHEVRPLVVAGVHDDSVTGREVGEQVVDVTLDALRRNAVLFIVGELLLAPAAGIGERAFHRSGHGIGVEYDAPFDVTRGAPDCL